MESIIVIEPGKQPDLREVEKLDLETMQSIVGGLIQRVPLTEDIDLWFNEEGRMLHLPFNRDVTDNQGTTWDILGTMFLTVTEHADEDDEDGDRTVGLSPSELLAWAHRLSLPEVEVPEVPEGCIAVWHAKHPNFAGSYMWDTQPPPPWPSDFEQVALVVTSDINRAWEATNHIDHAWQENPDVKALKTKARSSSVGDVFVLPGGKALRVDSFGFVEINP